MAVCLPESVTDGRRVYTTLSGNIVPICTLISISKVYNIPGQTCCVLLFLFFVGAEAVESSCVEKKRHFVPHNFIEKRLVQGQSLVSLSYYCKGADSFYRQLQPVPKRKDHKYYAGQT